VRLGKHDEGVDDYARALTLIPPSMLDGLLPGANREMALQMNNWAWYWAVKPGQNSNPHKALFLARNAVELAPDKWLYRNTLGVVCYRLEKYQEARQHLERSLHDSQGESDGFDLFFLAMCHQQLGDAAAARDCHDRAVRWVQEKQTSLPSRWIEELKGFRAEAETLLRSRNP
jgi:tetratricopeptide (TPR) repeat protein